MGQDSLGDRMKGYEHAYRLTLPRRMPVMVRVDGKAFHTLTRHCERPFDLGLMAVMDAVALALCEEIQGAQLAFVQSDEISILVHNYKRLNSQPWFANELQKMASVSAGIASSEFTRRYAKPASFDARVFVLPEAEVANYFIWRQQDATRNSIQMAAHAKFSHAQCNQKNLSDLQEMLFKVGINWNEYSTMCKRGRCVLRDLEVPPFDHPKWRVDAEIPIFTSDRAYVEKWLAVEKEAA